MSESSAAADATDRRARKHEQRALRRTHARVACDGVNRAAPLLLVVAAACASGPAPLRERQAPPAVRYELAAAPGDEDPSPQRLHIELLALAAPIDAPSIELAAAAMTSESGLPFRGASTLPPGTRWLDGEAAARWIAARAQLAPHEAQVVGTTRAVVAGGLVTRVRVPADRTIDVQLTRDGAAGATDVVLVRTAASGARDELRLREPLPRGGGAAVLFVPQPVDRVAGHALVLQADGDATADAVAAAMATATVAPPRAELPAPWQQAFAAVGAHRRRPALLALARPLGCTRVADVLLTADEQALVAVTQGLHTIDPAAPDAAWQLERATWNALLPRLERDQLPLAMFAAAARHFGAAVSDPTAVRLALSTAGDGDAFVAALAQTNRDALGGRDTAQRVRAHEWLAARGLAVPHYEPLAPAAERRAALRAATAVAAPAGDGGPR
jgi:hypothetical protein